MRKNAFTLVELLAVIIILSIVSVVAIPRLIRSVRSNTVDTYEGIVENIILAANSYANNQKGILVQIPVSYLQQEGYLPRNLSNPIDNTLMNGCVYVVDGTPIYKEEVCSTYLKGIEPSRIVQIVEPNPSWDFNYTGNYEEFVVPETGVYQIELWGASGSGAYGGNGGYTKGNITLVKDSKLYIYVGQHNAANTATFNALNQTVNNVNYNSGGGSTDIRTTNGNWYDFNSLKSRIMVAAGGGGYCAGRGENELYAGGAGGGLTGYNSSLNGETAAISYGATQTGSGTPGTWQDGGSGNRGVFGSGGSPYVAATNNYRVSGGGGGGYYGGSSGPTCSGDCSFSASGGSSYISGHAGSLAINSTSTSSSITLKSGCTSSSTSVECSKHYSGLYFSDTVMIDGAGYNWTTTKGSLVNMPTHNGTSTMTGNSGNGYAKITLLTKQNLDEIDLNLSGRTLGTPSSTAHTPENKRTWNLNTYVVNYNHTQNYYCENTNVNYTYNPPDNLYLAMTKTGCGGGYGFGIPMHIDSGNYVISYNANEWTHLAVNLYTSDGTYLGNAVAPNQFNVSLFYFVVPNNAYYTVISLPCNYDYGNGNRDATYSNIHLYKLD